MELVNVTKKIFFDQIDDFDKNPVSYNKDLDIFLEKRNFTVSFFILKNSNILVGFLPIARKKDFYFSLPYFSYGLQLLNPPENNTIVDLRILFNKKFKNYYIRAFSYNSTFNNNYKVSVYLQLKNTIDDQLSFFKSKLRSQIKRSIKNELKIKYGGIELIDQFYLVYSKHMHALGSPSYSKSLFLDYMNTFKNDAVIFLVKHKNINIACSLCLINKNQIEVILAASTRRFNYLSSNMFLYWEMIKYSIFNNISLFSFGRSDYNSSQLKFKKQWSDEYIDILQLNSNRFYNLKVLKSLFSFFYKKIPYSIANKFGSIIADRVY